MTAIVAIKRGKHIIIGGDSIATQDNLMTAYKNIEEYKISHVNGSKHCLIASAGSALLNKAIRNYPSLLDGKEDPSYNYMVNKIVPKLFQIARDNDSIKVEDGVAQLLGTFIIATKSHLYEIQKFGEVNEATDCLCIGCGALQANAKFYQIHDRTDLSLRDMVLACLMNSVKYGVGIGYPLVLLNNIDSEIEVITKNKSTTPIKEDKNGTN